MAAADATLASIESTRFANEQTLHAERTPTPNGLTNNQPEISTTNQDNKSPLNGKVLAGAGATPLIGLGTLRAVEGTRRKKAIN
jgi:hypothetical protein